MLWHYVIHISFTVYTTYPLQFIALKLEAAFDVYDSLIRKSLGLFNSKILDFFKWWVMD